MPEKPCILVVEDDPDSAAVIDWMLRTQQLDTVVVSSGEAALEELSNQANRFSAIMIDLALPQMDGFELLSHVKDNAAATPAVAMTAFYTPELREKALNSGFAAFVPKPLDQDYLVKTMKKIIA